MGAYWLTKLRKDPSPPLLHKGEGLNLRLRSAPSEAGRVPRVFSPLVGEMAGRPEGVSFERVRIVKTGAAA
jgi:hypothetical protein